METPSSALQASKFSSFIYVFCVIITLGLALFCYGAAVIWKAFAFIETCFNMTVHEIIILTIALVVGASAGVLGSKKLGKLIGYKYSLLLSAIGLLVSSTIFTSTQSLIMLVAEHLILGVIIGIISFIVPRYISKTVPSALQRCLMVIYNFGLLAGIFVAIILEIWSGDPTFEYRAILEKTTIQVLPMLMVMGFLFLPQGSRRTQQSKIFQTGKFTETTEEHNLPHTILFFIISLVTLQQLSNYSIIICFWPTIYQEIGFIPGTVTKSFAFFVSGYIKALLAICIVLGSANFLFTTIANYLTNKFGRRLITVTSFMGIAIAILVISCLAKNLTANYTIMFHQQFLLLATLVCCASCFSLVLSNFFWLLISKISPAQVREKTTRLLASYTWLFNTLIAVGFLVVCRLLGTVEAFAAVMIVSVISLIACAAYISKSRKSCISVVSKIC